MSVAILDAFPALALTPPGKEATLVVAVRNDGAPVPATLAAELREGGIRVASTRVEVELPAGEQCLEIAVTTPDADARGYEAVLELELPGRTDGALTAVLVASHWRHAPRYGFVSEFPPGDWGEERIRELAKFHINVVQFYDWMYRHYRFLPPQDEFEDAMGRTLSLETVKRRVEACGEFGMAALAYGAVYGAEPEYVREHPDSVLRNARGEELSLIDLFYITDLRPGAQWREQILEEFEEAVRTVGFGGIHMDQYGFPKWSYDAEGKPVNLAEYFPGLIDEAACRVGRQRQGAEVLFNAVNNWPLEKVAPSDQAAVYIEVWPPHDHYRDLCDLIRRGRDLSRKHVILAAYLEPFRHGGEGAEQGALLATAVIATAGGFHLLLGEGDGVLRDPYYPNHGRMAPEFRARMRRYYDHTAVNHQLLFDERFQDVTTSFLSGINEEIMLAGAKVTARPERDAVWANVKQSGKQFVLNLVNLIGQRDTRWNEPKDRTQPLAGLVLGLSNHFEVERVMWSSPDEDVPTRELPLSRTHEGVSVQLPDLLVWATIMLEVK